MCLVKWVESGWIKDHSNGLKLERVRNVRSVSYGMSKNADGSKPDKAMDVQESTRLRGIRMNRSPRGLGNEPKIRRSRKFLLIFMWVQTKQSSSCDPYTSYMYINDNKTDNVHEGRE